MQTLPSSDKVNLQFVIRRSELHFNNQAVCVFIPERPATLGSRQKSMGVAQSAQA